MRIKDLEIIEKNIVHENEMRKILEIFDGEKELAKNCKAFIVTGDGWLTDHYRDIWETYAVVAGEVKWFFEDMKTGSKEKHLIKTGGVVKIPPKVAHALKVKPGTIIIGRYETSREKTETHKHILEWARNDKE